MELGWLLWSWDGCYGVAKVAIELRRLLWSWDGCYGVAKVDMELRRLLWSWDGCYGVGTVAMKFNYFFYLINNLKNLFHPTFIISSIFSFNY